MLSQTTLIDALEENDPASFIKTVIKARPELRTVDDGKDTLLSKAVKKHRPDVIPYLLIGLPRKDEEDNRDIDLSLTERKTALLDAFENQTQFDISTDILLALGASKKKAIDFCHDDTLCEKLRASKIDRDIFCGLLYSAVINVQDTDLLGRLENQISVAKQLDLKLDTKVDSKSDLQNEDTKIPLEAIENDLFALTEYAAANRSLKMVQTLLRLNQNRMRWQQTSKTALGWADFQEEKQMIASLHDATKVLPNAQQLKISRNAKIIYDQAKAGKVTSRNFADGDYFLVLEHAYALRNFVALNAVIEFCKQNEKTHVLFEKTLIAKNRGLFFILVFASDQLILKISRDFPQLKDNLLEFFDPNHTQLPLPEEVPFPLNRKLQMIDTCLQSINDCVKNYTKWQRFGGLPTFDKLRVILSGLCMASLVIAASFIPTLRQRGDELLEDLSTYPSSIENDCQYAEGHGTGLLANCNGQYDLCPPCDDLQSFSAESGFTLTALAVAPLLALILLFYRPGQNGHSLGAMLFSQLDNYQLADILNNQTALENMQGVVSQFQDFSDFKLTTASPLKEIREALPEFKKALTRLYGEHDLFAGRKNRRDHKENKAGHQSNLRPNGL